MPRPIPGFYYDEEKNKYFRIQRSHTLPTSSNVHTVQSVKAKKEEKQFAQERQQHQNRQHADHIQRSPITRGLGFKLLQHRTGAKAGPSVTRLIARYFAEGLTARPAYGINPHQESSSKVVGDRFHITREGLLNVIVQQASETPLLTTLWPSSACGSEEYCAYAIPGTGTGSVMESPRPVGVLSSPVMLTGFNAPYENVVCYKDQGFAIEVMGSSVINSRRARSVLPYDGPIWDAASCPTTSDLAICSGERLYLVHCPTTSAELAHFNYGEWIEYHPATTQVRLNENVPGREWEWAQTNVTFKDTNILMTGQRSGIVNFSDCRSCTGVSRLQHSSAVQGTTPTKNDNQIIVHGFSTTSMYDLRYTKAPSISELRGHNPPKRGQRPQKLQPSTPVLEFTVPRDRHSDQRSPGKKIAYSADLDLVVTCGTKHHAITNRTQSFVTLYSASTGRILPSPLTNNTTLISTTAVTCIDIKRLRDGPESILTLGNGELLEWTLHDGVGGSDDGDDMDSNTNGSGNGIRWSSANRRQKIDSYLDRAGQGDKMFGGRSHLYSIARRWEDGNLGPF